MRQRGYNSRGVILMLNTLATFTKGDFDRMKRLIFQTGLANNKFTEKRSKWTWIDGRIVDAIEYQSSKGQL